MQTRPSRLYLPKWDGSPRTIFEYILARFPQVQTSVWRTRVMQGEVSLSDGTAVGFETAYRHGITVFYRKEVPSEPDPIEQPLIIYQDEDILVADKPHGMPVTPSGEHVERSLLVSLQRRSGFRELSPVHRLDRDTAGLVLFTIRAETRARYHRLFVERRVGREYVAVAHATELLQQTQWRIENRIRSGEPWYRQQITEGVVNAITDIELVDVRSTFAEFRLLPKTGKKHQLRVHLAAIGYPIVGDSFYPVVRARQEGDLPMQTLSKPAHVHGPTDGRIAYFHFQKDIGNTLMISFSHIGKQYGRQILFVDASFQLNPGEKVGLVGPNGSGKTTLFRMIVGEESPDEGEVSMPKQLTVGYFRQDVEEMSGRSVLDEAIAGSGRLGDLHHELEALQHAMGDPAQSDRMDKILERFGEVQEEYDHLGGYSLESQAREVLLGLGFDSDRIDGDVGQLSGGWKMRVAMARVLLGRPDVLLMDEPTNHLDIESIVWLENFIRSLPGALLMTSHDREFMNRVVGKIAEIDGGEITVYSGNYDFYARESQIRETNREAAYARQQAMLAKEQRFIERFSAHAAKAGQVQSRMKALDKIEKIELPKKRRVVKFDFRQPSRSGDQVVTLENIHKAYGRRVVYDGLNLNIRRTERWCVMGKNGAGKSTLLKMVAGAITPDSGNLRLGASLTMGYFAQQALDLLIPDLTIEEQLQRDFPDETIGALRSLAGAFQFSGDDIDKKIRALSGGEKTRLVMARMLLNPPNFLVLDEPTNHLDLATKEMLIDALKDFEGTMLFVSHDRTFLRGLSNRVLELGGESGIDAQPHLYPGSYTEYVARTGHEAPGVHH